MEDSVGEQERREQEEAVAMAQGKKRGREEEQEEAGGGRVVQGKEEVVAVAVAVVEEAGFLSSMASKIGAAMSGTNGSAGAENGGEGNVNGNAVLSAAEGQDEKEDGHGGGGIFQRFMSSSSPSPPVTGTEEEKRGDVDADAVEGGGEQAGILSAMASKIGMAMSGANNGNGTRGGGEEDAKASNGDAGHIKGESKEEGHESNSNGIVKQLMSNLPTSDTRGPNAEEASMLIAIIED